MYIPLETLADHASAPWLQQLCTKHEPALLALLIIAVTTLYVTLGGLYSVVITDVIQTVILTCASFFIAYIAWSRLTPTALAGLPADWTSLSIPWRIDALADTDQAQFQFFGALVMVWVMKGPAAESRWSGPDL